MVIHEGETLEEVKVRVQKKLQVPDEEFSKVFSKNFSSFFSLFFGYLSTFSLFRLDHQEFAGKYGPLSMLFIFSAPPL